MTLKGKQSRNLNIYTASDCFLVRHEALPLLEEGEADTDGHVVDTQRNRVSLLWTVLIGDRMKYIITTSIRYKNTFGITSAMDSHSCKQLLGTFL